MRRKKKAFGGKDDKGRTDSKKKREDFGSTRKRSRYLEGVTNIDPHDYDLLRQFVTDHGKIMAARLTGATAKQQRQIKHAVRRARVMGLLP